MRSQSPSDECRLDEAAALLTDADLTVAQIARAVGYADAFGFSAAFKRHKAVSPSLYRRQAVVGTGARAGTATP